MKLIADSSTRSSPGRQIWPFWKRQLKARNVPFKWLESDSQEDIVREARRAAKETVVAVGGDAMINNVINGLLMSGRHLPLGVLCSGLRSDFCRFHRIPTEKTQALTNLLSANMVPADVAEATMTGGIGERAKCFFSCGVIVSLGAVSARLTQGWRRLFGEKLGQRLGIIAAGWGQRPFKCALTLDGEKFEFNEANQLIIFKNPYLAESLELPESASGADGRLTLILIHTCARLRLIKLLTALFKRNPLPRRNVFARSFTQAVVVNDSKLEVEFNGDSMGYTPMEVNLKTGLLTLIRPPEPREKD